MVWTRDDPRKVVRGSLLVEVAQSRSAPHVRVCDGWGHHRLTNDADVAPSCVGLSLRELQESRRRRGHVGLTGSGCQPGTRRCSARASITRVAAFATWHPTPMARFKPAAWVGHIRDLRLFCIRPCETSDAVHVIGARGEMVERSTNIISGNHVATTFTDELRPPRASTDFRKAEQRVDHMSRLRMRKLPGHLPFAEIRVDLQLDPHRRAIVAHDSEIEYPAVRLPIDPGLGRGRNAIPPGRAVTTTVRRVGRARR
jgi:hypothetical protein